MVWHDQWADIARHRHSVTVGDIFTLQYAEGRIKYLEKLIPKILPEDSPIVAKSKAWRSLWLRLLQYPERKYWQLRTRRTVKQYKDPAPIRRKANGREIMPNEDPFINDLAYILDLFANQYGWSEKQILRVPFCAVNEYVLAIESRQMRERISMANAMHPSEEGSEFLSDFPKRDVPITGEMLAYINKARYTDRLDIMHG